MGRERGKRRPKSGGPRREGPRGSSAHHVPSLPLISPEEVVAKTRTFKTTEAKGQAAAHRKVLAQPGTGTFCLDQEGKTAAAGWAWGPGSPHVPPDFVSICSHLHFQTSGLGAAASSRSRHCDGDAPGGAEPRPEHLCPSHASPPAEGSALPRQLGALRRSRRISGGARRAQLPSAQRAA